MEDFNHLLKLSGTPQEQAWLRDRLETLSVREGCVLTAALMRQPPGNAAEAIGHLQSLDSYEVCFPAGSYEQLGRLYARQEGYLPDSVLPHVDMERLGQLYEDIHPGLFVGNCYVRYPSQLTEFLSHENSPLLQDSDWSVKLKLASPAVPEGVWLRLPDHDGNMAENSGEVRLVLDTLRVKSLEDCTLLEARCVIPEAGNLTEQYDSVTELVMDGDNLGIALEEQGQGEPHWLEKFAAALEYEGCSTLRLALDISQNMQCYHWVPYEDLAISAEGLLLDAGVPKRIIDSGCIDLAGYKADLLESAGYMLSSSKTGYLLRNSQEFVRDFTAPEQGGMTTQ